MGIGGSSEYAGAYDELIDAAAIAGGCDTCGGVGGIDNIEEYLKSARAGAKTTIIKSVLDAASKIGFKLQGESDLDRVKSLLTQIPSGDKFRADPKAHADTCRKIAQALNSAYAHEVVNVDVEPEMLCRQVLELVASLTTSMHTEFIAVLRDVRNVIENLQMLQTVTSTNMDEIKSQISQSTDTTLQNVLQTRYEAAKVIQQEADRQISLLSNLLNVQLAPSVKDIEALLKKKEDVTGYIKKLDIRPGDSSFGRVIADVLHGMANTAGMAVLINKALAEVGLNMSQYKAMKNVQQLNKAAYESSKNMSDEQLDKFMIALKFLTDNLYRREEFAGASEHNIMSDPNSLDAYQIGGGAIYEKSKLDKRIENKEKLRTLIFSTFVRELDSIVERIIGTLDLLSMKVGSEIPLSDQLDGFRESLNRLETPLKNSRKKQSYYALTGYYNDARSKSHRDSMIGELRMVSSFIDTIVQMPMYSQSAGYFQAVQAQIKAFIDLISKYSEEIGAKFGRGEGDSERTAGAGIIGDVTAAGGSFGDDIAGAGSLVGDAFDIAGGSFGDNIAGGNSIISDATGTLPVSNSMVSDVLIPSLYGAAEPDPVRFRSGKTITDAIKKFDYNCRVAQIRSNLARAGPELAHYGEKYEKLVAHSIAELLKEDQAHYLGMREYFKTLYPNADTVDQDKKDLDAATAFLDAQWDAKKKFWATIEAVDSYMKAFTDGVVNNLNDVKDIRSALDDIEIIRDWYSTKSGESLFNAFEKFGVNTKGTASTVTKLEDLKSGSGKSAPARPYNLVATARGEEARGELKKMFTGMTALKNLMSIFVHFGSKFGGSELSKKVFMTPAQIYNNLVTYLQASALAQGMNKGLNFTKDDGKVKVEVGSAFAAPQPAYESKFDSQQVGSDGTNKVDPRTGVWMRSIKQGLRDAEGDNKITFNREDDYFVIMLKALAAKILTVTGMYDVLHRPLEANNINPVRMILGGNDETPKVDEGAVALYLRLPLLCQFWREIFGFNKEIEGSYKYEQYPSYRSNDKMFKISMVPDVEGTFSGLIKLMFRKNKFMNTSAFNDDDLKELIRECNLIYQRMLAKYPQNTVMETIYELIAEVNRRYGVVSEEESKTYEEKVFGMDYLYYTADYNNEDETEIALLPGEEDEEIVRPSAAERLLGSTLPKTGPTYDSKYGITKAHKDLLWKFRCALDKYFEKPTTSYNFKKSILSVQQKLKRETRDEERFKIVSGLIRGVDVYSQVDGLKYIMFHESVVTGLNVLCGVHTLLSRFQSRAQMLDVKWHMKKFAEWLDTVKKAGTDANSDAFLTYLADELLKQKAYHGVDANAIKPFVYRLYGYTTSSSGVVPWEVPETADGAKPTNKIFKVSVDAGGNITIDKKAPNTLGQLLNGKNVSALSAYSAKCESADKDIEGFFRYFFDNNAMMRELLENLYALKDLQSLVTVKIDESSIYVSANSLKDACRKLFEQVSQFVEIMRPHVDSATITKYTDKMQLGSLYWVQEQLFEKIIVGRPQGPDTAKDLPYYNIEQLSRTMSDCYKHLTREYSFDGKGIDGYDDAKVVAAVTNAKNTGNDVATARATARATATATATGRVAINNSNPSRNGFGQVFAEMIFYDGSKTHSGLLKDTMNAPGTPAKLIDFMTNEYDKLILSRDSAGKVILDTRFATRFYQLYTWEPRFSKNRSALFDFNQLIAKYIQNFYDVAEKKMYSGLVYHFANGTFSNALKDLRNTYPDIAPAFVALKRAPGSLTAEPKFAMGPDLEQEVKGIIKALPKAKTIDEVSAEAGKGPHNGTDSLGNAINGKKISTGSIDKAKEFFPFDSFEASTDEERKNRLRLFVKLAAAIEHNPAAKKEDLPLGGSAFYYTGDKSAVHYIVKEESFYKLNTDLLTEQDVPNSSFEEGILLLARKEHIPGAADAGSIKQLGVPTCNRDLSSQMAFGQRADPSGDHVLFTSLSAILKNITSIRNKTGYEYTLQNMSDVPLYMRERMRANLPLFRTLFKELISRCEMLKLFANHRDMSLKHTATYVGTATHDPWPCVLKQPEVDSDKNKIRFSGILDSIVRGCNDLLNSIEQTLKEVGDDPKYLELYQNSIRDYKSHNGTDPLMPLSTSLHVLTADELSFAPLYSLGEDKFKLAYGMRGMLSGQAQTKESNPGWANTVDEFNLMVDNRLQVDSGLSDSFLQSVTKLLRFTHNVVHAKNLLNAYEHFIGKDSLVGSLNNSTNKTSLGLTIDDTDNIRNVVYVLKHDYNSAIMLTESSVKDDKIRELVDYMHKPSQKDTKSLAVLNILDLNIIPINVHALMRDIPLAPLMNYAYTFDRLVINLFGKSDKERADQMIAELCDRGCENTGELPSHARIQSAKDMLTALLINPYLDLDSVRLPQERSGESLYTYLEQMMLGGIPGESIGRPKFLSDQMYAKALLGSAYGSNLGVNEMGPAADWTRPLSRDKVFKLYNKILADAISKWATVAATTNGNGFATTVDLSQDEIAAIARFGMDNQRASAEDYRRFILKLVDKIPDSDARSFAAVAFTVCGTFTRQLGVRTGDSAKEATDVLNAIHTAAAPKINGTEFTAYSPLDKTCGSGFQVSKNAAGGTAAITSITAAEQAPDGDAQHRRAFGSPDKAPVLVIDDKSVDVHADVPIVARMRFDTVLARNLTFIVNLLRALRIKMHEDLVYDRDIITRSIPITRAQLTEFSGNEKHA